MAYSDNDEASAAVAWESELIESPQLADPLYLVEAKIGGENEIDTDMNEDTDGHIISENYGEGPVEGEFTSKEPKLTKLKIKLTPSEKKLKKKKKRKTKKEFDANVTEDMPEDENHDYKRKLIDNTAESEADIKEENHEPEIKLENIIKMEADDLGFFPEDIDPQMFMDTSDERSRKYNVQHNGVKYPCDQCEYVATRPGNLRQHKAAKHWGVRYPCDLCDHVSTQLGNLKQHKAVKHGLINLKTHKESIHQSIKYPCDQCDYVANQLGNLKQHKESKHEGIRYPCDECSHLATTKGHLRKHKETVHLGIVYPCDKCDLTFKSAKALRHHREAKHEGITWPCLSCEYIASTKALLKKHTQSRHDGITFSCDRCTYTTSRNEYLKRHKKNNHTDQDWETKTPPPDSTPRYPPVVQNSFLVPTTDPMLLHHAAIPKAVSDTLLSSNKHTDQDCASKPPLPDSTPRYPSVVQNPYLNPRADPMLLHHAAMPKAVSGTLLSSSNHNHTDQDLETKLPPPVSPHRYPPVVQNPYLNPRADSMFLHHAAIPKAVSDTLLSSNKHNHTDQDLETKLPPPDSSHRYPPVVQNPYLTPRADPMFLHHAAEPKAVSGTLLSSSNHNHTDQDLETKLPTPDSSHRYPPVVQNPFLVPTTDPMLLHHAAERKAVSDTLLTSDNPNFQAET